jgi:hypothetical protein
VCEVEVLDIVDTIREGVLVRDHELKGRPGRCSRGEIFTVLPQDTPREKEGLQ